METLNESIEANIFDISAAAASELSAVNSNTTVEVCCCNCSSIYTILAIKKVGLQYCDECKTTLRQNLMDSNVNTNEEVADSTDFVSVVPMDSIAVVSDNIQDDALDLNLSANAYNSDSEDNNVHYRLAVGYSTKNSKTQIKIRANNHDEIFTPEIDAVNNSSKVTRVFYRESMDIPLLYWYEVFGAYINKSDWFVTPCGIAGTNTVLVAVLRTRCFNPHYEALVYYTDTNTCNILQKKSGWLKQFACDLKLSFDAEKMKQLKYFFINRIILTFLLL